MMNQEKECLAFIDKKIPKEIGESLKKILDEIKTKNTLNKKWSAPALGKFPEETESGYWTAWWTSKSSDFILSLDFYNEKEIFYFWRDRKKDICIGEECTIDNLPEEMFQKILTMKFGWEKEDYDTEDNNAT